MLSAGAAASPCPLTLLPWCPSSVRHSTPVPAELQPVMGSRAPKPGRFPCISLGRCCGFLLAGFPAAGVSGDMVMCCSLGTPPCTGSPVAVPVTPSAEALRELGGGCYPRLPASQPLLPASREPGTVQGLKPGVFCSAASSAPLHHVPIPVQPGGSSRRGALRGFPPSSRHGTEPSGKTRDFVFFFRAEWL